MKERRRIAGVFFFSNRRTSGPSPLARRPPMLGWALTFLVVALIAAVLGFTSIVGAAMGIAKILFFVFLVLFAVSLVMHLVRGRRV
jgi:uncharacterized membrane protein YtjA (UPF0391 family)